MRVAAERTVSRAMGGSCSMPLAAHADWLGERLRLRAAWGEPEGSAPLVRAEAVAEVSDLAAAESLGARVAAALREGGAHASAQEG
jgi:hydroxymethylbilane synthase